MVSNDPINLVDLYGLAAATCKMNLFFGHGDVDGKPSQQTKQRDADLVTIKGNNERHEYAVKGGNKNDINSNCSIRFGYGGCQAEVANKALPVNNQAYNPSDLNKYEDKNGDVPFDNITQAIDAMLISSLAQARKDCSGSQPDGRCPCSSVIIELKCATQGGGRPGNPEIAVIGGQYVTNTSIENIERVARAQKGQPTKCGGQWKIDCKNPLANPVRIK